MGQLQHIKRNVFPLLVISSFVVRTDDNETANFQDVKRNSAVNGLDAPVFPALEAVNLCLLLPVVVLLRPRVWFELYPALESLFECHVMRLLNDTQVRRPGAEFVALQAPVPQQQELSAVVYIVNYSA